MAGYIVYHFAHYGIGRTIHETDNMIQEKKKLEKGQPGNEITCIVIDKNKKKAIEKYNKLYKKFRQTEKKKREKRKKKANTLKKKKRKTAKGPPENHYHKYYDEYDDPYNALLVKKKKSKSSPVDGPGRRARAANQRTGFENLFPRGYRF